MRVLVVGDDAATSESLVRGLSRHGYQPFSVGTGKEALQAFQGTDLILLDLDLPDVDGLELCRRVRAASDIPIISFTGGETELDCVLGLQAGSDDCIVAPYGFRELIARIEAVMRRARPRRPVDRQIARGPLRIDPELREVRLAGREIPLTRKEFDLLYLLASQPDKVLSRQHLMSTVWDDGWSKAGRTIDTHVSTLRNKLGSSSWIITVRGVGFRIGQAESAMARRTATLADCA